MPEVAPTVSEEVIPLEPDRLSDVVPETEPVKPPALVEMEREMEIPKKVLAEKVPGKVPEKPSEVKLPEKILEKLPEVVVPEKVPEKRQEFKVPEKVPEKRPEVKVPEKRQEFKVPEKQPEVKVPEKRPEEKVPEKQPETKVPEKLPEVKVSEKRPAVKVPKKAPEKQPEVKVPDKQPKTEVPEKVPKKQPERKVPEKLPEKGPEVKVPERVEEKIPEVKAPEKEHEKRPEVKTPEKLPEKQPAVMVPEKVPERVPSKVTVEQQPVKPLELIVGKKQSPETKPPPVEIPVKMAELKTEMVSKKHRETISVEKTTEKIPEAEPQVEEPLPKGTAEQAATLFLFVIFLMHVLQHSVFFLQRNFFKARSSDKCVIVGQAKASELLSLSWALKLSKQCLKQFPAPFMSLRFSVLSLKIMSFQNSFSLFCDMIFC